MKHFIRIALYILLAFSSSEAATLYMGTGETHTNLQSAMTAMSSGDTLVIRDGTYTGASNAITNALSPPIGTPGAYTTIRAENAGAVIFDGEDARTMFSHVKLTEENKYWKFDGIIWCRSTESNVNIYGCDYVKFLRCGFYDCGSGNYANFSVASNCSYVLAEGCYAYGSGRYKFLAYLSDHVIFRTCVARSDRIDAAGEPCAQFSVYSSTDSIVQNCIAIDSDQKSRYTAAEYHGPFITASTLANASRNTFKNSVGLNIDTGGTVITGTSPTTRSEQTIFSNVVMWDCQSFGETSPHGISGYQTTFNHCTLGVATLTGNVNSTRFVSVYNSGAATNLETVIKNTVMYGVTGGALYYVLVDYNASVSGVYDNNMYYGNEGTNFYYFNNIGGNDINTLTTINPIYHASTNQTGGLKYLPRIETESNMSGLADDSGDIGANILHLVGTPETLWGETGYDTQTETLMWPYPNEDLIKTKMAGYTYDDGSGGDPEITGARGFCATGTRIDGVNPITLTSYIWEYLGNQIPPEIYGAPTYDTPTITGPGDSSTTSASAEIEGDYTVDSDLPDQSVVVTWTLGESSGFAVAALGVFSCTVTDLALGVNSIVFEITDSNSGTDSDTTVVTRTVPAATPTVVTHGNLVLHKLILH